jgi:hypothetical protein
LRRFGVRAGRSAGAARPGCAPGDAGALRTHDRDGGRGTLSASSLAILRAIAKNAAKANGDWRPAEVTAVPTTHAVALSCATPGDAGLPPGAEVPADTPVFLVTMTGQFSGDERRPTGPAAPAGRYLSLVVNARSFWVMDSGLSRKAPRVRAASLGPVANIAW